MYPDAIHAAPPFIAVSGSVQPFLFAYLNALEITAADSDKIGTLKAGESVTRTGTSDNGWSKVSYNGGTGYIKTSVCKRYRV